MKYLVLADEEGIVHVMWCGIISDSQIEIWRNSPSYRWCACEEHIMGRVCPTMQAPTCIPCARNLHEYAESRYDGDA